MEVDRMSLKRLDKCVSLFDEIGFSDVARDEMD